MQCSTSSMPCQSVSAISESRVLTVVLQQCGQPVIDHMNSSSSSSGAQCTCWTLMYCTVLSKHSAMWRRDHIMEQHSHD
jgi:hypothetical protein